MDKPTHPFCSRNIYTTIAYTNGLYSPALSHTHTHTRKYPLPVSPGRTRQFLFSLKWRIPPFSSAMLTYTLHKRLALPPNTNSRQEAGSFHPLYTSIAWCLPLLYLFLKCSSIPRATFRQLSRAVRLTERRVDRKSQKNNLLFCGHAFKISRGR